MAKSMHFHQRLVVGVSSLTTVLGLVCFWLLSVGKTPETAPYLLIGLIALNGIVTWFAPALSDVLHKLTETKAQTIILGTKSRAELIADRVVTDNKITRLESALQQSRLTAQALKTNNEDLNTFVDFAARDLKDPLQAIENLIKWTLEDHSNSIPNAVRSNLTRVSERTRRLSTHVTGLAQFAMTGQLDASRGILDLPRLCAEIQAEPTSRSGFVVRTNGEIARFDVPLIPVKSILRALVTNAIQHSDKHTGKVLVSAELVGPVMELSVHDNGPGIPKDRHAHLFSLKSISTGQDEPQIATLGLPLAQKLAHRIGANITVQSDPETERGTVVTLRLPRHVWDAPSMEIRQPKVA